MDSIDIIIETPKGSREKYHYDLESGRIHFKKALPLGMVFPYDFGFVPGTKGEDGDPLDALVISEFAFVPGCSVSCRLIGALLAEQYEDGAAVRNDRYFFVPELSDAYKDIRQLSDLGKEKLAQLEAFFVNYNAIEGKEFKPIEVVEAGKAYSLLKKG